jgi:hypothetical protein
MIKSLMEGQYYRLRSAGLFFGDMMAYWRQLKKNQMCEPGLNSEFLTTDVTFDYVKSEKNASEFQFIRRSVCFGDHATILKHYLEAEKFKHGASFEINQIMAAFLECCTRSYLDRLTGRFSMSQDDIENYLRHVKKRLLNPRMTILEEMSDRYLSEVERNVQYLVRKQIKEGITAFDPTYLSKYLANINYEQDKRRELLLEIPISTVKKL